MTGQDNGNANDSLSYLSTVCCLTSDAKLATGQTRVLVSIM